MSSQLELIMQLYMMNLLQQQQLQQQQQQHQFLQTSPTKEKDITSSTTTAFAAQQQQLLTQQLQQQHHHNTRTQTKKRPISQNTNCSSSSSSSPNSNSSPLKQQSTTLFPPEPLQQMLLNNLPPLTQLMAATPPPSNLLLTPTTPNTNNSLMTANIAAAASSAASVASKTLSLTDYVGNSNFPFQFSSTFNRQFTASNFLQSSTVTSTPTEKSPIADNAQDISAVGEGEYAVRSCGVIEAKQDKADNAEMPVSRLEIKNNDDGYEDVDDDDDDELDEDNNEDEDDKPLSSLFSSSDVASTSTSLENSNKLLTCSGVHPLESTPNSMESPSMPYTPIKQPADSSYPTALCSKETPTITSSTSSALDNSCSNNIVAIESEDTNVTPPAHANAILTPPSSEQLVVNSFESSQTMSSSLGTTLAGSLTTASSLDAFLQDEENLKNLKKFTSYLECDNSLCRQENLREHFHCFDEPCQGKILSKKDDIIRHLKWHKKRKESLLLGFARFSSSDDCAPTYGTGCAYNWKQTHYHCVYEDCPKVYVSTSDVQMHANFHRKNSEIVQEGFRRFRAHENCKIVDCPFYGKKTSHYHCCRDGCNHTFKNKADMDKHKTYHLKDHQLTQDGFKKILKTENCPFEECKFSTVSNHIHCVREGCNYILHSSSQMISHKRKHDRLEGEQNYQNFKKQKDSSEEESPKPVQSVKNVSTPLSSLTTEQFLARKRGRPPKKIQLPTEANEPKRIKSESNNEQLLTSAMPNSLLNMFPPFMPNFNNSSAMTQSMQSLANAPNFQMTHLMALFQFQNPLFYQNLYSSDMAANMMNILGSANNIKSEFNDKQQYKE